MFVNGITAREQKVLRYHHHTPRQIAVACPPLSRVETVSAASPSSRLPSHNRIPTTGAHEVDRLTLPSAARITNSMDVIPPPTEFAKPPPSVTLVQLWINLLPVPRSRTRAIGRSRVSFGEARRHRSRNACGLSAEPSLCDATAAVLFFAPQGIHGNAPAIAIFTPDGGAGRAPASRTNRVYNHLKGSFS
ncbi:hypothetical protein DFH09DRAFT_1315642 [Mycena vulgaris]|nr:hypothetical protein DFH09DRAFT_1315642 [Mycena vulgaris]